MTIVYRKGAAEFREAVRKALNAASSDKDIEDCRWWIYADGRNPVATEAGIDAVIEAFTAELTVAMKTGRLLRLRGFGVFFVGKILPFPMSGAVGGISVARKVVRFRPCKALQAKVMASPKDIE